MKKYLSAVIILLVCSFGVTGKGMAEPPDDIERPFPKARMAKMRERIDTLRMWKLTKALELDEKTSAKLFPVMNRYDKRRLELEQALGEQMRELKKAVSEKREGQLKALLDSLEQNYKSLQDLNIEERAELKTLLSLEQQAKFVIFQHQFNREIRRLIAETQGKNPEKSWGPRAERGQPADKQ